MLSKLHCFFINALKALEKSVLEHLENGFCDCEIQFVSRKNLLLGEKRKWTAKELPKEEDGGIFACLQIPHE